MEIKELKKDKPVKITSKKKTKYKLTPKKSVKGRGKIDLRNHEFLGINDLLFPDGVISVELTDSEARNIKSDVNLKLTKIR